MSDMTAKVTETLDGFAVAGYEKINYDFKLLDDVFAPSNPQLADCYMKWGRVLAVMDENMKELYGASLEEYFDHYELPLTIHAMPVGEKAKTIHTLLGIVDAMNNFGIIRKVDYAPLLVPDWHECSCPSGTCSSCWRWFGNGRCWVCYSIKLKHYIVPLQDRLLMLVR